MRQAGNLMRWPCMLLLIMLSAQPAMAEGAGAVFGAGLLSCKSWMDLRKARDSAVTAVLAWVSGYVSGTLAHHTEPVVWKTNGIALQASIDRICARTPSQTVQGAAEAFLSEHRGADSAPRLAKVTRRSARRHNLTGRAARTKNSPVGAVQIHAPAPGRLAQGSR
jgi:hypothetical protein